jgi:hypothetical protein
MATRDTRRIIAILTVGAERAAPAAIYQNVTLNIVSGRFGLPSGRKGRL